MGRVLEATDDRLGNRPVATKVLVDDHPQLEERPPRPSSPPSS
jgi:hypothetical protein